MKCFLDTNVLAYAFDVGDPAKQAVALRAARELADSGRGVVSTQIMQELFSALTRKLGVDPVVARQAVRATANYEVVTITPALVLEALDCSILDQLSVWDALVVTAAAAARCGEVWTEDLNDGQTIRGVRIHNPFRRAAGSGDPTR